MADEEMAERIDELEIKLAFQDHKIAALDGLVRALSTQLEDTQRQVRELKEAMRSPEVPLGPSNDPPPHY